MKKILIFQGGWDGHDPVGVSERFANILAEEGYDVELYDSLECLTDAEKLCTYDLIVPCWTMGEIPTEYTKNVCLAVSRGTGLAGCHGGMCDAFRIDTDWQFLTGGQFVAHPGNHIEHTVNIIPSSSPITEGIKDFSLYSEQYYMHVDPAIEVLATTRVPLTNGYHAANKSCDMPVAWTKYWGLGRVFYLSVGHNAEVFRDTPEAELLMKRGMIWAAEGKEYAEKNGIPFDKYEK